MSLQAELALAIGIMASVEDLWRRKISNWIPVAALVAGFAFHLWSQGWHGLLPAFLGAAGGFAVFLVFYMFGGMGGGDVKLMAGLGSIIGIEHLAEASLFTAIIGAALACVVVVASAVLRYFDKSRGGRPKAIPYAPAIVLGVLLSLVPR